MSNSSPSYAAAPELIRKNNFSGILEALAVSNDGKTYCIAVHDDRSLIQLYDMANGKVSKSLPQSIGEIKSIAFSNNGQQLAHAFLDQEGQGYTVGVRLWDLNENRKRFDLKDLEWPVVSLAFSPDDKVLAAGDANGKIYLWDLTTQKMLDAFQEHADRVFVTFSPDNQNLASTGYDGEAVLWNLKTRKREVILDATEGRYMAVAFTRDGKTLVAAKLPGEIRAWDLKTGTRVKTISIGRPELEYDSMAFSPDLRTLATGDEASAIKLWDVSTGAELARMEHTNKYQVKRLAFSRDGRKLVSGANYDFIDEFKAEVKLWDLSKFLPNREEFPKKP